MDSLKPRESLHALTSLRFFLALMVLVGHFAGRYPASVSDAPIIFALAPIAVSWFFVLSGFIIAYNYPTLDSNRARTHFLILRFARLWPVHAVLLTIWIVVIYSQEPIGLRLFYGLIYSRESIVWHFTLTQAWSFNVHIANAFNGPAWSISNELFFYLCYVLLAAPSRVLRFLAFTLPVGIGIYLAVSYGCMNTPVNHSADCNYIRFQFPPIRLLEFIFGIGLYKCWRAGLRIPQVVGLGAIVAALFIVSRGWTNIYALQFAIWWCSVVAGGGLLVLSLARPGWLATILNNRPLILGGEISYSMYMSHQLVYRLMLPHIEWASVEIKFAATTVAILGVSAGLFFIVEVPARDYVKRLIRGWRDVNRRPIKAPPAYRPGQVHMPAE